MPNPEYISSSRSPFVVIGPSIAYIKLSNGLFAVIDSEDCDLVGGSWTSITDINTSYAQARRGGNRISMHRLIMGSPDCAIDHRNRNGLHNWKGNLRNATRSQNAANKPSSGRSGLKGAYARSSGWQAAIRIKGKTITIGTFATAELAHAAYCAAAKDAFGDFFHG